ncbi:MAG TPA: hypothetical protein VLI06_07515 [Solimonas sp.]|nr:hypothetical protein [Solimonas sp.]
MNQSLRARPRFLALPIAIASVGLGLSFYYGEQWYQLSQVPEAQLQEAVELNLLLDLKRDAHKPVPGEQELEARRETIRGELQAHLDRQRHQLRGNFLAALAGFGLGAIFLLTQLRPQWLFGRR